MKVSQILFLILLGISLRSESGIPPGTKRNSHAILQRFLKCSLAVQRGKILERFAGSEGDITVVPVKDEFEFYLDFDNRQIGIFTPSFSGRFGIEPRGPPFWYQFHLPIDRNKQKICLFEFWDNPGFKGSSREWVGFDHGRLECDNLKTIKGASEGAGEHVGVTSINGVPVAPLKKVELESKDIFVPVTIVNKMWQDSAKASYDSVVIDKFKRKLDLQITQYFSEWEVPTREIDYSKPQGAQISSIGPMYSYKPISKEKFQEALGQTRTAIAQCLPFAKAIQDREWIALINEVKVKVGLVKFQGADSKTFHDLGFGYAVDRSHVYFNGNILEGFNPTTFHREGAIWQDDKTVIIDQMRFSKSGFKSYGNGHYVSDGVHLFPVGCINSGHVVEGADLTSFRVLQDSKGFYSAYGVDSHNAYFCGVRLSGNPDLSTLHTDNAHMASACDKMGCFNGGNRK